MRRVTKRFLYALAATFVSVAPATAAPSRADQQVALLIERQRAMLIDAGVGDNCRSEAQGEEIIVCGERVVPDPPPPPPPRSRLFDIPGVHFGAPPPGMGTGVGATIRGCFLQKCPKKFVLIDLNSIPVAAPGSDADLIARGEMRDR